MIKIAIKHNIVSAIKLWILTVTLLMSVFLLRKTSYLYKSILLIIEIDNICKDTI
ncbi:SWPV2-ORF199 [Shearwaterpox virus]|uniref:SWPV2-ORF199 n=1 Tax=Shearwaterpox virus TaxID=1974596 RepID=A0A1V0QGH7_CNPV|nr:SWPV2-ORF199 [Shearwaterpox virus]QRI42930.1 hypothetical protein ChPV212 [Cheloniid poxvirus 1]QRM15487.1 hypothetical protein [Mudlarkpox virus]QRM15843.1 hypothetical protein [Penguinpox virus 2]QRM16178.1 hypothetical protein [Albatrosspox virus]